MLRKFLSDKRGNFAVITAIAMLPMILAVGFAIDGSRYYKARAHLQDAVDIAALAVAASEEQDTAKLKASTEQFILSNIDPRTIEKISFDWFKSSTNEIDVGVRGSVNTTFMQLANVKIMQVEAETLAKRAPEQIVEVALVLDNTYSMSAPDPKTGETRIATLRKASKSLVETLLPKDEDGTLRIALVPYADHVNVGMDNKTESWLTLSRAEGTESGGGDRVCEPKVKKGTETYCSKYSKKTCTSTVDGILVTSSCNDQCIETSTRDTYYEQKCTGTAAYSNTYKFHGCVGTRSNGVLRLSDASPTSKYPAYVETSQKCARPIIPLTKNRDTLLTGVAAMTHQPSNYVANTHIPSGVVWGLNVLSPLAPFIEADDYDPENRSPRKIMILMTDGDNTLKYQATTNPATDGKHVGLAKDADFANVNNDTAAVCSNAKSKGIEIYSVAFAVTKTEAKDLLRKCATSDAYYYDATDAAKLEKSFKSIAQAISQVRLAK